MVDFFSLGRSFLDRKVLYAKNTQTQMERTGSIPTA